MWRLPDWTISFNVVSFVLFRQAFLHIFCKIFICYLSDLCMHFSETRLNTRFESFHGKNATTASMMKVASGINQWKSGLKYLISRKGTLNVYTKRTKGGYPDRLKYSSTLDSWICEADMFSNILYFLKSDLERSKDYHSHLTQLLSLLSPPPPHTHTHTLFWNIEKPAHKSVGVFKYKRSFGKLKCCFLVTSQSVKVNGYQYASLLLKKKLSLLWSIPL